MTTDVLQLERIQTARFIERPNRFIVRCRIPRRGIVDAFLPNPGRLWELLFPDVKLYVTSPAKNAKRTSAKPRKTDFTVVAVERDGVPVLLHTHLTNRVAQTLIEQKRIPELAHAQLVRPEVTVGRSRFDFLLRDGKRDLYVEVKSCTLFGNNVAMFPDAITERGRRHLEELAELRKQGVRAAVLFLVQTPSVQWFMPDYHTDLAFAETLLNVRRQVQILPISVQWNADLMLGDEIRTLEIPWHHLRREVKDRGSYLLILRLDEERSVEVGSLGSFTFPRGHYIYVGSAMRALTARVTRHCRRRKKLHWHIDYLRQVADECVVLPIRSSERLECDLAASVGRVLGSGPTGFGASDCDCPTHLFHCDSDPLDHRPFHAVLESYRMRHPRQE
jgi:sugar fermentation stimulation protein A